QPAERRTQICRVTLAVQLHAQHAFGAEARRKPADRGADTSVPPHPAAQTVLFPVCHARPVPSRQCFQLVDQPPYDIEAATPEGGVSRIESERCKQLLV